MRRGPQRLTWEGTETLLTTMVTRVTKGVAQIEGAILLHAGGLKGLHLDGAKGYPYLLLPPLLRIQVEGAAR
jgi:hypothetical protein